MQQPYGICLTLFGGIAPNATVSMSLNRQCFRYFCPREGWGYPSNGENEVEIHCQHDGTWSNDANIETCMSK